jgi:vancomycin resistance protein YoaR
MEGPVINSQSPAPAAVYEDDPTLPKGTTKQVDFSAGGASVTVKRKVIRGDKIIQEDTFQSNYRPWRAIYKVGTG